MIGFEKEVVPPSRINCSDAGASVNQKMVRVTPNQSKNTKSVISGNLCTKRKSGGIYYRVG